MAEKQHYIEWVYEVTKQIPKGRVTTYGHIADYLALGSARMVGWALKQLPSDHNIPAHRVVNHKGELSGRHHFSPPEEMQRRLEQEGLQVSDAQIINFREHLWVPAEELNWEEPDI
ncbi:MAG: MGMT family protein [Saprospiraceae bacterium]|nr:MGMT family protein [Saprospiraceae bacterium]